MLRKVSSHIRKDALKLLEYDDTVFDGGPEQVTNFFRSLEIFLEDVLDYVIYVEDSLEPPDVITILSSDSDSSNDGDY